MEGGLPSGADLMGPQSSAYGGTLFLLLASAAVGGWIYFRYLWLPYNRPALYRAWMLRNTERKRREAERRTGMVKVGGFAARLIANRCFK